jgi:hypothetical protein
MQRQLRHPHDSSSSSHEMETTHWLKTAKKTANKAEVHERRSQDAGLSHDLCEDAKIEKQRAKSRERRQSRESRGTRESGQRTSTKTLHQRGDAPWTRSPPSQSGHSSTSPKRDDKKKARRRKRRSHSPSDVNPQILQPSSLSLIMLLPRVNVGAHSKCLTGMVSLLCWSRILAPSPLIDRLMTCMRVASHKPGRGRG